MKIYLSTCTTRGAHQGHVSYVVCECTCLMVIIYPG